MTGVTFGQGRATVIDYGRELLLTVCCRKGTGDSPPVGQVCGQPPEPSDRLLSGWMARSYYSTFIFAIASLLRTWGPNSARRTRSASVNVVLPARILMLSSISRFRRMPMQSM